ncbi:PAS domain S-box protein [Leptospira fluminis]|uniref:histidine kinase n=1 Tax=Leptospira fluminis TaxID=2484979 RepID=A0A4R9GPZ1_9LEPT|nr:ATP-binding protein [Leptospira fluminis]TGK19289.1 PAS domain S-box protein [Leptospira fluminis]
MAKFGIKLVLGIISFTICFLLYLHFLDPPFSPKITDILSSGAYAVLFLHLGLWAGLEVGFKENSFFFRAKTFSHPGELRRSLEEKKRAEALLQCLFDGLGTSLPLHQLLIKLMETVERFSPDTFTSVVLLDPLGARIENVLSPSLPQEYLHSLEKFPIGPKAGSCGTSAYTGKTVIVEDIRTNPLWADYKHLAVKHCLRACWSTPIRSPEGKIIGTFAIYYKTVRAPLERDLRLIFFAAYLVQLSLQYQRSEEGRRKSENKYRDLVENASDGIFVADSEGKLLEVNPSGCRMLGYKREELLKLNLTDLVQAEDLSGMPFRFFDLQDRKMMILERRLVRKDKTTVTVEISAKYLDSGLLQGIVRDVSERTAAERTLRQAQKMESIGLLAGGIAHDFNNLLTMILGTAEVLRTLSSSNPELKRHSERIIEACSRGKGITKQLLLFSSPVSAEMKPTSLPPLLKEVTDMMRFSLPKNISLQTNFSSLDRVILADSGHLHQAVMNLILNARDALPNGGRISVQGGIVDGKTLSRKFPGANETNYVELDIADTGVGIEDEYKDRIFEPFYTTKGKNGTGLGLSIVRGIVTEHSGFISVESEKGKGTRFSLYFPIVHSKSKEENNTLEKSNHLNLSALLVDDEELVLEALGELLRLMGAEVRTCKTAEEAILLYKKTPEKFDVVITDLEMPGMGGEALICQLFDFNPQASIIVTSGNIEREKKKSLQLKGVQGFLDKPYKASEIGEVLGKSRFKKTV